MTDRRKYSDRADYIIKAVSKRRKRLKRKVLDYLGGKCSNCGYDKCTRALSVHHKNPAEKEFGLSEAGMDKSWERIQREADKCILICANCHMELHCGEAHG
jgi:5-methylcytosine-specific restriction endonuclease McrA